MRIWKWKNANKTHTMNSLIQMQLLSFLPPKPNYMSARTHTIVCTTGKWCIVYIRLGLSMFFFLFVIKFICRIDSWEWEKIAIDSHIFCQNISQHLHNFSEHNISCNLRNESCNKHCPASDIKAIDIHNSYFIRITIDSHNCTWKLNSNALRKMNYGMVHDMIRNWKE